MADPITLGAIAIGGTVLGTMANVSGVEQQTSAQVQQLQYQAGVAARNKEIALQNADYARWAGESEAQRSGLQSGQVIGRMRAGQGASNLDVNFGSNVQVRQSQHDVAWNDQRVIRSNAAQRAYAFENEAATQEAQGKMYMLGAANTQRAGSTKIASTIISGATSVATKWLAGGSTGVFPSGSNMLGNVMIPGNWGEQG